MGLRTLIAIGVLAAALPAFSGPREDARRVAHQAATAERALHIVEAYALWTEAARLDPSNHDYTLKAHQLRPVAELAARRQKPESDQTPGGHITASDLAEARQPQPPAELLATPGVRDFDLRGDARVLFEQVAREFGLAVMFDTDYDPGPTRRFQLAAADYRTALHALEAATDSFVVPATDRLVFVARDTADKRTRYERTMSVIVPVPDTLTPQDLQEQVAAVRGAMDIQRVVIDSQQHLVLMRDRVSKVLPAQAVFQQLMHGRAQLDLGVELLVADKSRSLTWGFSLPNEFPMADFGHFGRLIAAPVAPSGFTNLLSFGGGKTLIGIGVANAGLFATASKTLASSLYDATVAASDGLPASMHVGQKYPIATTQYSGSGVSGNAAVYTPTVQFEDLGLSLKITPHVHGTEEVTLEVEAQFELLGANTVDGIPELDDTKFQSSVRLRTGEWAVITGLLNSTQTRSLSGIAGLASVPVLGSALSTNARGQDRSETLIVIKPVLRSLPAYESTTRPVWTGSEGRSRAGL